MVSAEEVVRIYKLLADQGIQLWLTGGWGIDALLGEQTRLHKDMDVIMLLDDVRLLCQLLEREGYSLKELWEENRWAIDVNGNKMATGFYLQAPDGREFDVHAMRMDDQGNGVPAWDVDEGFIFTKEDLAGAGMVAGFAVQCITPESQMICHTDYELPEKQVRDLNLLHERFGVARR